VIAVHPTAPVPMRRRLTRVKRCRECTSHAATGNCESRVVRLGGVILRASIATPRKSDGLRGVAIGLPQRARGTCLCGPCRHWLQFATASRYSHTAAEDRD